MTEQKSWDFGRFLRTAVYFDTIPFLSNLDWFRQMILGSQSNSTAASPSKQGIILVAGATGGVGKRVVERLQSRKIPLRALVRSIERARTILGEDIEFYEGDITIADSLKAELMEDVTGIICCTGTRVQPVGGDTPDRQKYYQGVKFYPPEIAESTPEAVEYKGIKNLVTLAAQCLAPASTRTLFDFTRPTPEDEEIWGAVDDVVMGGVSESGLRLSGDRAIFMGKVSTENNGGFASVRTRNLEPPLDLSGYEGIQLRLRGDGQRYKFILRCENRWDGVAYSYSFDTQADTWLDVSIPFSELVPVFRAKTLPDAPAYDASKTYALQVMLSKFEYDKALNPRFTPGTFALEMASICAYGGSVMPQFIMVSSAGVTRPGRPGLDLENEPPAVRMNDQLGGILTWKLRGEDSVRESGLPYTIIRPCALTEEPGDKTLHVEQGDNLKGQVSRDRVADLCIEALSSPQAVAKTFEVAEERQNKASNDWEALFTALQSDT